jgi:hypothetical protein
MTTKIISRILLTLALAFVLGSAITHVHGATQGSSPSIIGPPDQQFPVVTINSVTASAAVTRGQIGTFVLSVKPQSPLASTFVNFSVSGTAVSGVDYTPLVSPAFIGQSGLGVILVKTLPALRASVVASVVVTLEPGPGYAVGEPSSAQIFIKP